MAARKLFISLALLLAVLAIVIARALPSPLFAAPLSTALYADDGTLLGARIARDGQWRFPPRDAVPAKFAAALIAAEDKRFRHHPGVDPLAIARALRLNLQQQRVVSGGSTLTMQLVRLARGNPPRSLGEKALEALLALRLELTHRKATLLALYAANAPFGGNVVGLEAASWRYFGRAPESLSWAEAATLAVLPNSPGLIHPGRAREALHRKRDALLHRLTAQGAMSAQQLEVALLEPLPLAPRPLPRAAPHLLDTLAARPAASPQLFTTLDGALQREVNRLLAARAAANARAAVRNAAALVLDNATLAVRAYVGNAPLAEDDAEAGGAVDIVQAPRSTGSLLKPFLFALAVQDGRIQPGALIPDVPVRYEGFRPENFDRQYRGAVTAGEALALSLNVPAVHLLRSYGQARFYDALGRLGMTTLVRAPDGYGLSLILGGAEGSLWDLAGLYAQLAGVAQRGESLARSRYREVAVLKDEQALTPTPLPEGEGNNLSLLPLGDGRALLDRAEGRMRERRANFGAGAAWLTLRALREVGRPEDEAHWKSFASSLPLAWKTGTSYGLRDGWAIGVTPRHTIAVWVGNASGEGRAGLTGAAMAAPLLFDIAHHLGDRQWFATPWSDLREVSVCADDGYLPSASCATTPALVPLAAHFETVSAWHQAVTLDRSGRWRVDSRCEAVDAMTRKTYLVLPPVMEAYRKPRDARYAGLPRWRADCAPLNTGAKPFDLVVPQANLAVLIPTELGGVRSKLVLQAVHRDATAPLFWHLDGNYLATTQAPHQLALDLPPGEHQLTLVDGDGVRMTRRFEVLGRKGSP